MKLTIENARYALVRTALHGGGVVSLHNSPNAALDAEIKYRKGEACTCGCVDIVCRDDEARQDLKRQAGFMLAHMKNMSRSRFIVYDWVLQQDCKLIKDVPNYDTYLNYRTICL